MYDRIQSTYASTHWVTQASYFSHLIDFFSNASHCALHEIPHTFFDPKPMRVENEAKAQCDQSFTLIFASPLSLLIE